MNPLGRRALVGALVGAVVGAVVGVLLGLFFHEVFDVSGSPTGFELLGGAVGLFLGAILGVFYGGLSGVPRDSHVRSTSPPD